MNDLRTPPLDPLLEFDGVDFDYVAGRTVLREVSVRIPKATITAVIGPNGSGKSTLLRLMAGLERPRRGRIRWLGNESVPGREQARRMAWVGQDQEMAFPFTTLEAVLAGRSPHHSRFAFETGRDVDIAREAMRDAGIEHLGFRPVTGISGGERQLVAFARALAQEPAALLLDEPSSSLDPNNRWRLLRVLDRLRRDRAMTSLVVTHDLSIVDDCFDSVLAMRGGRIVAHGAPDRILSADLLGRLYDDRSVRTVRIGGRTFVWSEGAPA